MRLCVDLCSGLGGFSAAFRDAPDWEVVTVDVDPSFRPTIVADVCHLPLRNGIEPEVLLMSPPCERFSKAPRIWPKKGIGKALELVGACLEAVVSLNPKYWCLENPHARLRWFIGYPNSSPELGNYGYRTAKPTDLWGNIPFKLLPSVRPPRKGNHHKGPWESFGMGREGWRNFDAVRDPKKRALMPDGLSQAILEAVS